MPATGIGLFAGFDLYDVSSIRLLGAGLDYALSGGNSPDIPALADLTKTQKATTMDIPYRMQGSPLLDQIMRTFLNTPRISKEVMLATGRDLRDYANYASINPTTNDYQKAVAAWMNQVPMPLPFNLTPEQVEEIHQAAMRTQIRRLTGNDGGVPVPKVVNNVEHSDEFSDDTPVPKKGKKNSKKKSEDGKYPNTRGTARSAIRNPQRKGSRAAGEKTIVNLTREDVVDSNISAPIEELSVRRQGRGYVGGEQGKDEDPHRKLRESTTIGSAVSAGPNRAEDQTWLEDEQLNILVYMSIQLECKNHVKWNRLANTYNTKRYNAPQAKGEPYLSTQRDEHTFTPAERLTPWRTSGTIKTAAQGWDRYRRLLTDMEDYRQREGVSKTIERDDYESSDDDVENPGPGPDGKEYSYSVGSS